MAETMNDAVSRLLPPQILSVDVVLMDKENGSAAVYKNVLNGTDLNLKPTLFFPSEFPYEFDSALSSLVESIIESTDTKATSDEEEFLAGLIQRLTHSSTRKLEKSWEVAGSPDSTLSGLRSMSVSSNGSPNGSSSLVSSPPMTPSGDQNDTWDLISAAAGQIARLKMSNCTEIAPKYTRSLLPPKSTITSPAHVIKNHSLGLYTSQIVIFDLVANTNQQYVKQEPMLKAQKEHVVRPAWASSQPQQVQNRGRNFGYEIESARCGQQLPQSTWPPLQVLQHQRPVFVAGSGCVKRECAGTGVFLPRRDGLNNNNPHDSRRNSAFPSVLVPHVQQRFHSSFVPNYDAIITRRNALITLQKRNLRTVAAARSHHELHLPKEWTY